MNAPLTRKMLWIRKVESKSGLAPLDFKMARYVDYHGIVGADQLKEIINSKRLMGIGDKTLNKLRELIGIPTIYRIDGWKAEANRLYKLLEKHKIAHVKKTQAKRRA